MSKVYPGKQLLILLVPKGGANPHGTKYRGILSPIRRTLKWLQTIDLSYRSPMPKVGWSRVE